VINGQKYCALNLKILNGKKLLGKDLDKALWKDKVIKENLPNYAP